MSVTFELVRNHRIQKKASTGPGAVRVRQPKSHSSLIDFVYKNALNHWSATQFEITTEREILYYTLISLKLDRRLVLWGFLSLQLLVRCTARRALVTTCSNCIKRSDTVESSSTLRSFRLHRVSVFAHVRPRSVLHAVASFKKAYSPACSPPACSPPACPAWCPPPHNSSSAMLLAAARTEGCSPLTLARSGVCLCCPVTHDDVICTHLRKKYG